jgi:hypothetical protein
MKASILDVTEHPIAYSQYIPTAYPYMEENLVSPLYNPTGSMIGVFYLTYSEKTQNVNNNNFLRSMGVGPSTISVTQKACFPIMKDFP